MNVIKTEIKKTKEKYRKAFKESTEFITVKKLLRKINIDSSSYYSFMAGNDNRLSISKCKIIMNELKKQRVQTSFNKNIEIAQTLTEIEQHFKSFELLNPQENQSVISSIPFAHLEQKVLEVLKALQEAKEKCLSPSLEETFNDLKSLILKKGTKYPRKYHDWYDYKELSYTINLYPTFEKINDSTNQIEYTKINGVVTKSNSFHYSTNYILVVDNHFIKESTNIQELWNYVADNYILSIDYFGEMSKEEIRNRKYTDLHEGSENFISTVTDIKTEKTIDIQVQDILYIDNYLDDENMRNAFDEYIKYCCK